MSIRHRRLIILFSLAHFHMLFEVESSADKTRRFFFWCNTKKYISFFSVGPAQQQHISGQQKKVFFFSFWIIKCTNHCVTFKLNPYRTPERAREQGICGGEQQPNSPWGLLSSAPHSPFILLIFLLAIKMNSWTSPASRCIFHMQAAKGATVSERRDSSEFME